MQNFGSFKIRGIVNQFHHLPDYVFKGETQLITMSAGNYGRSFAEACEAFGAKGRVLLPHTAPIDRSIYIEKKGLITERLNASELPDRVKYYQEKGFISMHPFDDPYLIYGYASISKEIFDDQPQTDVIVTGCGGGGLLSGVAYGAKSRNPKCLIYGVEPITANCMFRSFEAGKPMPLPDSKSIASGLSPPYAGTNAYAICKDRVEQIILVSEEEIRAAVKALYGKGLVVEPAGCAAFAALMYHKIPNIANKHVALILTGRNISIDELSTI